MPLAKNREPLVPQATTMEGIDMKYATILLLFFALGLGPVQAQDGKAAYDKYCSQCHGDNGDGEGYATPFVLPKPRDFTTGVFKFRSTGNEFLPTDEDLARVVRLGIPGTSMPAFDHIGEQAISDVVTYIKTFFAERIEQDKADGVYPRGDHHHRQRAHHLPGHD